MKFYVEVFSLRVDRAPKLKSDSSGCEYRMLPFHTHARKWKSKAKVCSDADSPGHFVRLLWWSNNVECGHCSAGDLELNGHQIVVVGLLLSLKTKERWSFPVASVCGSCPLGCYRMHRPYNLPLPMLVHWVNPTFSRSGGIWLGRGWGICKLADKYKAFLESLLGKEAPSQWHLPALQIPQGECFSLLARSGCVMHWAPSVKLFSICFCISHRLWAPLRQGWCPLFIPRKWHGTSHVEVSKNWKNIELGHRAWASKSGGPASSPR